MPSNTCNRLLDYVEHRMQMQHIYQPNEAAKVPDTVVRLRDVIGLDAAPMLSPRVNPSRSNTVVLRRNVLFCLVDGSMLAVLLR